MSKKPKSNKKKKATWVHRQIGTHLSRNYNLDPRHPKPHEPGEKRGTGKPFIKVEVLNAITYKLSDRPGAHCFTHHEQCGKTITGKEAENFIRLWLSLEPTDFLQVVKTSHTFTHDIPKLKVEKELP